MSAREISLITAVSASHVKFLPELWQSIRTQTTPGDWSFHWYVQEDGPSGEGRSFADSLSSLAVSCQNSDTPGGVAETRNLALARVQGEFIMVVDADDVLTEHALRRTIKTLTTGAVWCGAQALDYSDGKGTPRQGGYSLRLQPDGTHPNEATKYNPMSWRGPMAPGQIGECWESYAVLPFHPATFATRTDAVWKSGGWPGLQRDEDTAMILALTDVHAGVVLDDANIMYRHHSQQTSRTRLPITERTEFIRMRRKHSAG